MANPKLGARSALALKAKTPDQFRVKLDAVVNKGKRSSQRLAFGLRDIVLVQASFKIYDPGYDVYFGTQAARDTSGVLTEFLHARHIQANVEVYQTYCKGNTRDARRPNSPEYMAVLEFLKGAKRDELEVIVDWISSQIARTAKPVPEQPKFAITSMTFARVTGVYSDLLSTTSQGIFEQYCTASLLSAYLRQLGTGLYVDTKGINASDQSAKAAGDIGVRSRQKLEAAYEVTASSDWKSKVDGTIQKARLHKLTASHIIADLQDGYGEVYQFLADEDEDISVLDVRGYCAALVSLLEQDYRAVALKELYRLLVQHAQIGRVQEFVECVYRHQLADRPVPKAARAAKAPEDSRTGEVEVKGAPANPSRPDKSLGVSSSRKPRGPKPLTPKSST